MFVSIQYDMKKILNRLERIETQVVSINNNSAIGMTVKPDINRWNQLPLLTNDDLVLLEETLCNKGMLESLTNRLASVGGISCNQMTRDVMNCLFSKSLSLLYSGQGRKGKKSFVKLKCYGAVIAAVMKQFPDSTEAKIKMKISSFLAQAVNRDRGRKKGSICKSSGDEVELEANVLDTQQPNEI
ncbi:uncharacterized protein LOC136083661 [Hydra vulgaris]|uniref:Uncharacterized protein LOC136083661 n=1 Tax=Hydra vulgaris TaxID=6087 RepID=A0ABM4CCA5_HYDVU